MKCFLSADNSCKRSSAFQWKESHALMTNLEACLDQEEKKKVSLGISDDE
jgi:hypothetical protein